MKKSKPIIKNLKTISNGKIDWSEWIMFVFMIIVFISIFMFQPKENLLSFTRLYEFQSSSPKPLIVFLIKEKLKVALLEEQIMWGIDGYTGSGQYQVNILNFEQRRR